MFQRDRSCTPMTEIAAWETCLKGTFPLKHGGIGNKTLSDIKPNLIFVFSENLSGVCMCKTPTPQCHGIAMVAKVFSTLPSGFLNGTSLVSKYDSGLWNLFTSTWNSVHLKNVHCSMILLNKIHNISAVHLFLIVGSIKVKSFVLPTYNHSTFI